MRKLWILHLGIVALLLTSTAHTKTIVNRVIAVVNNDAITKSELDQTMTVIGAGRKGVTAAQIKQEALSRLIDEHLLRQAMSRSKIVVSDADLAAAYRQFLKERNLTDAKLRRIIAARGMPFSAFQQQLSMQIKQGKFLQTEIGRNIHISEAELRDFYRRNVKQFATSGRVRIAQILIPCKDPNDPKMRNKAYRKALKIAQKARHSDFAEVARKYSSGPEAADGGDMGVFDFANLDPNIASEIKRLRVGVVSEPILSAKGYHILKVLDRGNTNNLDFTQMKPQIEKALYQQKMSGALEQYIGRLRSNAYIDIRS